MNRITPKSDHPASAKRNTFHSRLAIIAAGLLALAASGCTLVSYRAPSGERFTRAAIGANTSVSALTVEADTNGIRRVEMQGYQNDSSQALGMVTEAAVKAAIQTAKP